MNIFLLLIPPLLVARLALMAHASWSWSLDALALVAALAAVAKSRFAKGEETKSDEVDFESTRTLACLAESELDRIFELSQDVICIATFDGRFKFVNGALERLLGWNREHVESRSFIDLVFPEDRDATIEAMSVLAEGRSVHGFENRYLANDGSTIWLSWNSTPDLENRLIYAIAHEVTDKKRYEQELELARNEAERANRTKSEFLANMSHEIRTPLNAIAGFSDLLSAVLIDDKHKKYAQSIKDAGNNLLVLLNDILELSKLEAGMMNLELGPVSLNSMIDEVGGIFSQKVAGKELSFKIVHADDLPPLLVLDQARLRQVLLNLVGNALKFTHAGTVTIETTIEETHPDSVDISIHVRDTGIGIPAEHLPAIFDTFRQQQGQPSREFGGTGLGLALSRRLVEIMGGTLSVKSRLGEGSVFTVHLAGIGAIRESDANFRHQVAFDPTLAKFAKAKILVVDDIESNRELLFDILSGRFEVVQAGDGEEAIRLALETRPDLILMDIRMPVMDGREANRRIKLEPTTAGIPVVALTASVAGTDLGATRMPGFQAVLGKPIVVAELLATIGRFIAWEEASASGKDRHPPLGISIEPSGPVSDYLRQDLRPRLEKLSSVIEMDKLRLLAEELDGKGALFGAPALLAMGERLASAVECFDIQAIMRIKTEIEQFVASNEEGKAR